MTLWQIYLCTAFVYSDLIYFNWATIKGLGWESICRLWFRRSNFKKSAKKILSGIEMNRKFPFITSHLNSQKNAKLLKQFVFRFSFPTRKHFKVENRKKNFPGYKKFKVFYVLVSYANHRSARFRFEKAILTTFHHFDKNFDKSFPFCLS